VYRAYQFSFRRLRMNTEENACEAARTNELSGESLQLRTGTFRGVIAFP
jgi:hypothetical protein